MNPARWDIRPVGTADREAVRDLIRVSFGDDAPLRLYDALVASPQYLPTFDVAAWIGEELVGHVMLSEMTLLTRSSTSVSSVALTPLSVAHSHRGRGIARYLVDHAVSCADAAQSWPLVFVEGDPRLYTRFNFVPTTQLDIERPHADIPEFAFQARLLGTYDHATHTGRTIYPAAYRSVLRAAVIAKRS